MYRPNVLSATRGPISAHFFALRLFIFISYILRNIVFYVFIMTNIQWFIICEKLIHIYKISHSACRACLLAADDGSMCQIGNGKVNYIY